MIVTKREDFLAAIATWTDTVACDTETAFDNILLGVSLSSTRAPAGGLYVPIVHYDHATGAFVSIASPELVEELKRFLLSSKLVGHNFTYDKRFIDAFLGEPSTWVADTRIMWHLSDAPAGPKPYSLKDGQTEILGWSEANDRALEANVNSHGGKLKNGDHYKADLPVLGKYAAIDAYATSLLYSHFKAFLDAHSYWPQLADSMAYNELLALNTARGVRVDAEGLQKAHNRLIMVRDAARKRFLKQLAPAINELETDWRHLKVSAMSRKSAIDLFLKSPDRWERFNLNSDKHKRELFYKKLGLPELVFVKNKKGKPKKKEDKNVAVSSEAIALSGVGQPWLPGYQKYEKANTLTANFTKPYLDSLKLGRLHPGFNICGTVSYRLSGFKPYLLNAPFDEKRILRNLKCDEGMTGVHADLAAIEPTVTAFYSDDPHLLKVFRDGLGDIYLDLALELFPRDRELREGYSPQAPVTDAIKKRFSKQRKIAKVVQLAVQYTGTGYTVASNLTKNGVPTTVAEAEGYVRAYWRKFHRVAQFNDALFTAYARTGSLRNLMGRIIRVPSPDYKDLPNRFIQSSAHDFLMAWVLRIYRLCAERGINVSPVLLDCHDSTSNAVPTEQVDALKQTYLDALAQLNAEVGINAKCEIKTFLTLAGLKADE